MKKIITIICLCIIIAAFAFMFVFSVCLPRTEVSDYSILKTWPEFSFESLFSGQYLSDVIYCFTDTIHARDSFIDYETRINDLYGIEDKQQVIVIYSEADESEDYNTIESEFSVESSEIDDFSEQSNDISYTSENISSESFESNSQEDLSEIEDESSAVTDEPAEQVPPELSGSVLIVGTRALEIYSGNTERAAEYANILNSFAEKLDPSVNVYSMVIPKASAYYIEQAEGYDNYVYRNKNDIDVISQTLSEKVIDVNIYNTLGLHANEDIYLRTDHHWSALGAYYASSVFAEKAGVAFADISEYTEVRREGYVGTMYKYSDYSSTILNNPEDFPIYYPNTNYTATYFNKTDLESDPFEHDGGFFWEISDNQKSSWYSAFLRGDSYAVKAVSQDCNNGRKLLIVKDSYGNALAPFMIEGFEEIYVIDARAYEQSLTETIEKFGITDVLFAECTFSAVGKSYIENLKELCK